ncbi:hypothetical protein [Yersinia enterocolitica]|uniref:hypothetical protein n=1 Tax=Yersinia enterocolitica TaxID=630 RepID=UPI001C609FCC|nr:hypothetical protein [Yersinia enterocolitica]MBW5847714.1 hypothetical protein [Yersinia enterocolitica]MBW5865069.1 hypothetical protein [Yersinia enterocolitica]
MNELLKSVKETIIDRIRNPFFFCFILSWLYFNWQSVLIIILSKKPIEERITTTLAGKLDPWHLDSLIYPAISAFIIAVAFPYLGVAIRFLHLQYENISEGFIRKQQTLVSETNIYGAQSKVKSDYAEELAKAKMATELANEEELQHMAKLNIDALNIQYETLTLSISSLEYQAKTLNETIAVLSDKANNLQNEINEHESTKTTISKLTNEIKKLKKEVPYSDDEEKNVQTSTQEKVNTSDIVKFNNYAWMTGVSDFLKINNITNPFINNDASKLLNSDALDHLKSVSNLWKDNIPQMSEYFKGSTFLSSDLSASMQRFKESNNSPSNYGIVKEFSDTSKKLNSSFTPPLNESDINIKDGNQTDTDDPLGNMEKNN